MESKDPIDYVTVSEKAKKGWQVAFAGMGVNLALGLLYAWSVFAKFLRDDLGWTATQSQLPYMIACGVFAVLMVPGGRIQDKIGPRYVIMAAAVFAGLGLIGSSFSLNVAGLTIFFGIFFGMAIGMGYSSTTPPAIKWFGPEKRGLVTGLVVSGFGVAAVYAAPLANVLVNAFGLAITFFIFGISFFIIVLILSRFIKNPPRGYIPPLSPAIITGIKEKETALQREFEWYEMLRTPQFYILWFMFCFGSLAGLMVIGQLSSIALEQAGITLGFVLVAILAIFNAVGRIAGGLMFDKIGQTLTLFIIFVAQGVNFLLFNTYGSLSTLLLGTIVAGFCYGACLSVFPATTAGLFGVRNLGINYGLVFLAWGAGGVFGGLIGGQVRDLTGSYFAAYIIAAALCLLGAALTFLLKPIPGPLSEN